MGRGQPPDQRGALRPPARPPDGLPRRTGGCTPRTCTSARIRTTAEPPRLHRDRLGQHLRAQPVPPAAARGPGDVRAQLHDHRRAQLRGRPGHRGHPHRDRDPASTSSGWRSSSSARAYAGEIKKSAFTVMNYLMPDEGVLPMHSSINVGAGGDACIFFGLSRHGEDDAVRRPAAQPHRRRRARLGRRLHVQLRGRLLRQDDPPVADVRARHLRDHEALRDDPRERRHRPADPRARPRLRAVHREHPRRVPARLHRQRGPDGDRPGAPHNSCS